MPGIASADFKGAVTLVNVWASWCVPCHDEAPLLLKLAEDKRIRMVGINYKDQPDNARRFLGRYGNPFAAVGADANGRASIDWGVYGVPETFVVDRDGRIAFKLVGPITPAKSRTRAQAGRSRRRSLRRDPERFHFFAGACGHHRDAVVDRQRFGGYPAAQAWRALSKVKNAAAMSSPATSCASPCSPIVVRMRRSRTAHSLRSGRSAATALKVPRGDHGSLVNATLPEPGELSLIATPSSRAAQR